MKELVITVTITGMTAIVIGYAALYCHHISEMCIITNSRHQLRTQWNAQHAVDLDVTPSERNPDRKREDDE
jgi:hypothetical protein